MDVPQFVAGRFRIEGVIGTGGMGTVYRATHLGLERPVAIKIIKPSSQLTEMLLIDFCARLEQWRSCGTRTPQ
jgi:serine/threonine-protein kinase